MTDNNNYIDWIMKRTGTVYLGIPRINKERKGKEEKMKGK